MAPRLGILVALPEDPRSIPSTHMVAYNHGNSSSRGAKAFFWPFQALGMPVVHRHTQAKISTHIKKIKDCLFLLSALGERSVSWSTVESNRLIPSNTVFSKNPKAQIAA